MNKELKEPYEKVLAPVPECEALKKLIDEKTAYETAAMMEPGAVRVITITHTVVGDGRLKEDIAIKGYRPDAVATLMAEITSAYIAVLYRHVLAGTEKTALVTSFLGHALEAIDEHRVNEPKEIDPNIRELDEKTDALLKQLVNTVKTERDITMQKMGR